MFLQFKKYELLLTDGMTILKSLDDSKIIKSDEIGWVFNYGPPHDHNWNWGEVYLEHFHPTQLLSRLFKSIKTDSRCYLHVCVEPDCLLHKDTYCSCGGKLISRLYDGKVIVDLYDLAPSTSEHTILFH